MKESGIVILNKPTGMSSNTAVNKVKKILNAEKAGHLGTLDPLGSGVLPITINKATKLFDYFLTKDKTYRAVFSFGYETDTLDSEGEVINKCEHIPSKKQLEETLNCFIGEYDQMPPRYSSKCINGVKAYKLARENKDFEIKPKRIKITDLKLLEEIKPGQFLFEISCSAGTYIRSLCRDIAYKNNTYGTMSSIIRTRCGDFSIKDSVSLEDIENNEFDFITSNDVIDLQSYILDSSHYQNLINGVKIKLDSTLMGDFKLYCNNEFFGIACVEEGYLKIKTNLRSYQ